MLSWYLLFQYWIGSNEGIDAANQNAGIDGHPANGIAGFIPPKIIASHRNAHVQNINEKLHEMPMSSQLTGLPEIDEVPRPDFLPGFVFGCVIMAGLTGIIVGLCLRIETIRRCQCLADITSCIMPEESEKSEQDSPLKEPLKKKGNDIHNPYPNFKVPEGLPGGLLMVSESPRLNRKNSIRSLSSFRTFKSWGQQLGRKPSSSRSGMKSVHRAGSVSGSITKSTTSSATSGKMSHRSRGSRHLGPSGRGSIQDDNRSVHSSRSSGTMRSRDGNWTSQSCQQAFHNYRLQQRHQHHLHQQQQLIGQQHVMHGSPKTGSNRFSFRITSPTSSRKSVNSHVQRDNQVLNPYEQTQTITIPSNFQKQASSNEAIVY